MPHLEMHQNSYRLVYLNNGQRQRIPLGTDDWYWAVARSRHLYNITLPGKSPAEVYFQIEPVLEGQVAPDTLETYRKGWQMLCDNFGRIDVDQITPNLLATWKLELLEKYSPTSVSIYLKSCQSVYSVLKKLGVSKTNPFENLKNFFPKIQVRTQYLTQEEIYRLRELVDDPLDLAYIDLLLSTGMRRGELYNLTWLDIDEERSRIELKGKTGTRYFPLWSHVKEILDRIKKIQPEGTKYVFTTKEFDHPYEPSYIGRIVTKYTRKAGFEGISVHALRHSFGTLMVPKIGIRAVQKLLGHKKLETTCRYENAAVTEIEEVKLF